MDADAGFEKMAVSYGTWRKAHGFNEGDAPTADEVALRLVFEKGAITPELTEAILSAVAPDVINAARQSQQASSVAPVPPELQSLLQGAQPGAPAAAPAGVTPAEEIRPEAQGPSLAQVLKGEAPAPGQAPEQGSQ